MSPRRKQTVLPIALSSLAAVLDLPAGTEVAGAEVDGDALLLTLAGEGLAAGRVDAEYSVDAHGHRTFATFKSPSGDPPGTPDGATPNPPNEEE